MAMSLARSLAAIRPLYRFSADAEAITMANKAPTLPFPPAGKG